MRRFEPEPRARTPRDFDAWWNELQLLADCEGEAVTIGQVMQRAPVECVQALAMQPARWAALMSRARYADRCRFEWGVHTGRAARRMGL